MIGHDHWKQANGDANIGKQEQPDRSDKGHNFSFAIQRAPREECDSRCGKRYWRQQHNVWPRKPAQSDSMIHQRSPNTDNANRDDDANEANAAMTARSRLDLSVGLQNKPASP